MNSRGFTLVEVIVTVGILTLVVLGLAQLTTLQARSGAVDSFQSNILTTRQEFLALIANQTAWNQTKAKNPSMACLATQSCTNGQGGTFDLYDVKGTLIYQGTNPKAGFTTNGAACKTFAVKGNDQCPIHVNLSWSASCDPTSVAGCRNASELVSVTYTLAFQTPHTDFQVRMAGLDVKNHMRENLTSDTPVVHCATQGKTYIGQGNSINGTAADAEGCVLTAALQGPAGIQGPPGPTGQTGATGPQGPQGPPGPTCAGI